MANAGDMPENFVEVENKVDIGETSVNLDCVKKEPKEEVLDFEEDSDVKQYRITLKYENVFGESSCQRKFEEDCNNLVGFLDDDVIMENTMIKLDVKEEDESFDNFHCNKCKGDYKGYCLKCSTLSRILNNHTSFITSESNTLPSDILEIRNTSTGKGVFLLQTLPINIIFGPFEGLSGIESTVGYCWKINDSKKFVNSQSGNWMKNIGCAASASFKNLDIIQVDGDLYFQTNREITEGEELLIYYNDEELQSLNNSEECLYIPPKQKLSKIFACTLCCLGYVSNKCLMEHKRKCPRMEHTRNTKDFELIECHYCKMWMEKWEHEEYHVAYCLEKHHRTWSDYSGAEDRSEMDVKGDKRIYRRDICSKRYDNLQCDTKDYQCFSGANHENNLNKYGLAEDTQNAIEKKYKCLECVYATNYKSNFQKHLNKHSGIKPFRCHICSIEFAQKGNLKMHIRNKHAGDETEKDYKCSECSFQTNYKFSFQNHLNNHRGIKLFQCSICNNKFITRSLLKTHVKHKHTENYYKCPECAFQTNYKHNYQGHLNNHSGIKQYQCDICMVKLSTERYLKIHKKNKHENDGNSKDYKCSECCFQTNYRSSFQTHLNTHSGIKPFQCYICMMKFSDTRNLKVHIRVKHVENENGKAYKCLQCSFQTSYKNYFQKHLDKHKGIKQYQCDICMEEFSVELSLKLHKDNKHTSDGNAKDFKCSELRECEKFIRKSAVKTQEINYKCRECSYHTNDKSNFKKHLNKHRGIKRFQCDICLMKFTEKGSIRKHIKNKHATEKEYKCSECSYETNYKDCFQRHLNNHIGFKPFNCYVCDEKFITKSILTTHIKHKHAASGSTKDYKCSECNFQTEYKNSLNAHINTHTRIKSFDCDICVKKFTTKGTLNIHIRNKHAKDGSTKDYKCSECSYQTNYKHCLQRHMLSMHVVTN